MILEKQHKALLFVASIAVKSFLKAVTTSYIFCKSFDPNILFFHCSMNIVYVGISIGAIIVMGTVFGYFIIRIKSFDDIFANIMKSDYIVTTMYFSMGFLAPALMSTTIIIWLFGIWILGMLLAPFNKEKTILKKNHTIWFISSSRYLISCFINTAITRIRSTFRFGCHY
jgi:hypothetical protein